MKLVRFGRVVPQEIGNSNPELGKVSQGNVTRFVISILFPTCTFQIRNKEFPKHRDFIFTLFIIHCSKFDSFHHTRAYISLTLYRRLKIIDDGAYRCDSRLQIANSDSESAKHRAELRSLIRFDSISRAKSVQLANWQLDSKELVARSVSACCDAACYIGWNLLTLRQRPRLLDAVHVSSNVTACRATEIVHRANAGCLCTGGADPMFPIESRIRSFVTFTVSLLLLSNYLSFSTLLVD